jgi:hypothetical protein
MIRQSPKKLQLQEAKLYPSKYMYFKDIFYTFNAFPAQKCPVGREKPGTDRWRTKTGKYPTMAESRPFLPALAMVV